LSNNTDIYHLETSTTASPSSRKRELIPFDVVSTKSDRKTQRWVDLKMWPDGRSQRKTAGRPVGRAVGVAGSAGFLFNTFLTLNGIKGIIKL